MNVIQLNWLWVKYTCHCSILEGLHRVCLVKVYGCVWPVCQLEWRESGSGFSQGAVTVLRPFQVHEKHGIRVIVTTVHWHFRLAFGYLFIQRCVSNNIQRKGDLLISLLCGIWRSVLLSACIESVGNCINHNFQIVKYSY